MTSRGQKGRTGGASSTIEVEIERAREEANWNHVMVMAEQLRQRPDRQLETLGNFLVGEAKLENFLEEYPPKDKNVAKAKEGLIEAKDYLTKTIGDEAKRLGKTGPLHLRSITKPILSSFKESISIPIYFWGNSITPWAIMRTRLSSTRELNWTR